jgi:hypothetical protein
MSNNLNKTSFIAGYIVRTDRSLSTLGSNGNWNYGNTDFRRTIHKRFFFKPKLKFEFDKTKQPAIYQPELELYNENNQHLEKENG